jgi:glucose/mannose-6-phosphate isomerase
MLNRLTAASSDADIANGEGMSATLARSLADREIGIVAPTCLSPAAYRFACQLNENSAKFARFADVPEMNHNEVVAWTGDAASNQALVLMSCDGLHPRAQARIDWMLAEIEATPTWRVECDGESLLERLLYAAHVTDWVSIGLAVLTGEDPSEMPAIVSLKAHLATIQ